MSTIKSDVGDLFYEVFMEALAEEAAPPKKVTNKFSNKTIQSPAEFESCEFENCSSFCCNLFYDLFDNNYNIVFRSK